MLSQLSYKADRQCVEQELNLHSPKASTLQEEGLTIAQPTRRE
jgi:hypothetical protein